MCFIAVVTYLSIGNKNLQTRFWNNSFICELMGYTYMLQNNSALQTSQKKHCIIDKEDSSYLYVILNLSSYVGQGP